MGSNNPTILPNAAAKIVVKKADDLILGDVPRIFGFI